MATPYIDPFDRVEQKAVLNRQIAQEVAMQVAEAFKNAHATQSVSELRERCVIAQLRACPEVCAKQIATEAEIMVQYILNGAEKE